LLVLELIPAPVECFLVWKDLEVACVWSLYSKGFEVVSFRWYDLQQRGFQAPLIHVEKDLMVAANKQTIAAVVAYVFDYGDHVRCLNHFRWGVYRAQYLAP